MLFAQSSTAEASKWTQIRNRVTEPVKEFVKHPTLDTAKDLAAAPFRTVGAAGKATLEILNEGVENNPMAKKILANGVEVNIPVAGAINPPNATSGFSAAASGGHEIQVAPGTSGVISLPAAQLSEQKFVVRMVPVVSKQASLANHGDKQLRTTATRAQPQLLGASGITKRQPIKIDFEKFKIIASSLQSRGEIVQGPFETQKVSVNDTKGNLSGFRSSKRYRIKLPNKIMEEIANIAASCLVDMTEEVMISIQNHECVASRPVPGCAALAAPVGLGGFGEVAMTGACPSICEKWEDTRTKKKTMRALFLECAFDVAPAS